MQRTPRQTIVSHYIALFLIIICGSCAGVAPTAPTAKLADLEYAIRDAREAEASSYSPLELQFAEDKYRAAKKAITVKEYEKAERLIDQARLDAQLAQEKSLSAKAEKDAFEMRQSIEALRGEAERIKKRQNPQQDSQQ